MTRDETYLAAGRLLARQILAAPDQHTYVRRCARKMATRTVPLSHDAHLRVMEHVKKYVTDTGYSHPLSWASYLFYLASEEAIPYAPSINLADIDALAAVCEIYKVDSAPVVAALRLTR